MSVFITNVDDFVAPGIACINPLALPTKSTEVPVKAVPKGKSGKISLEVEEESSDVYIKPSIIKVEAKDSKKIASISLSDCLACSGCVTTAETILLQEQGFHKLLARLSSKQTNDKIIVCISPQSVASLASYLNSRSTNGKSNYCSSALLQMISNILVSKGVDIVSTTRVAQDIAVIASAEEFVYSLQSPAPSSSGSGEVQSLYSRGVSATDIEYLHLKSKDELLPGDISLYTSEVVSVGYSLGPSNAGVSSNPVALPILCSHCPGVVCYAEKAQHLLLPHISTVKSAQQIMGGLMKFGVLRSEASAVSEVAPESIYFVSVQPCFDKKLESQRKDFLHKYDVDRNGVNEVDLVLSTSEFGQLLCELLNNSCIDCATNACDGCENHLHDDSLVTALTSAFAQHVNSMDDQSVDSLPPLLQLDQPWSPYGNINSGGYIEYISRYTAWRLWNVRLWDQELKFHRLISSSRSVSRGESDKLLSGELMECIISNVRGVLNEHDYNSLISGVEYSDNEKFISFVQAYGYKNLQAVVRRLKSNKLVSSRLYNNHPIPIHYIEIMACPYGCSNGSGQLKQSGVEDMEIMKTRVLNTILQVNQHDMSQAWPHDNVLVQQLLSEVIVLPRRRDDVTEVECVSRRGLRSVSELLYTRYHAVPKMDTLFSSSAKW